MAAGGVTFWFMRGGEEVAAKAEETKTLWMCGACSGTLDLTAKDVDVMAKEAGPPTPPLICAKCKEKKVYRAVRCSKCGSAYFSSDVPDSTGVCPKCNPDAKPPVIEETVEEVAPAEDGKTESDTPTAPKKRKAPKAA